MSLLEWFREDQELHIPLADRLQEQQDLLAREQVQEKVDINNEAMDVIFDENATDEKKQHARNTIDNLFENGFTIGGIVCGCGHPYYLRTDCLRHGG